MSATGAKHGPFSLIGGDVSISGNISATADFHIDGHVEGDISCAALVQGPESRIHGHVGARSARLAGLVDGSITADELIVEATGRVTGDVRYERITIEPGARIEGRFAHQNGEAAATELKLIANENAA
jgi:cytoskeletal protein CcmA (bactofilin family)